MRYITLLALVLVGCLSPSAAVITDVPEPEVVPDVVEPVVPEPGITPEVLPDKYRVYMITAAWCEPCQEWKADVGKWLEKSGWIIAKSGRTHITTMNADNVETIRKWKVTTLPTFILTNNGKEVARKVGYITRKETLSLLAPMVAVGSVATENKRASYGKQFGSQSIWTYPGRIDEHLRDTHGFSISELRGLSVRDMEQLHSNEHERGNPRRGYKSTAVVRSRNYGWG